MPDIEVDTICEWCGEVIDPPEDATYILDGEGCPVCSVCLGDYAITCEDCNNITHVDDSVSVGYQPSVVCMSCFDDDYFYCSSCDLGLHNDFYCENGCCVDCEVNDDEDCDCDECDDGGAMMGHRVQGIRRWGDAPELMFHDKDGYSHHPLIKKYYMGMEIEIDGNVRALVGGAMSHLSEHMWATTDATLHDGGVEVVTHPHTYDAWVHTFPWGKWTHLIHDEAPDQSHYTSNGIHIHVSRTAFANTKGRVLASHLYKFMQFIQINQDAIQALAGREGGTYCRWEQDRDAVSRVSDAKAATSTRSYERYRPVNTQNPDTIELRFFDGRTDPTFMKRSIQFVHSLIEFTRIGDAKRDRKWETYVLYVRQYALRYSELVAYLNDNTSHLLFAAALAEARYKDHVMPYVKRRTEETRVAQLQEQQHVDMQARERQERINNPPICDCTNCERDRTGPLFPNLPLNLPSENITYEERQRLVDERNEMIEASGQPYRVVRTPYLEQQPQPVSEVEANTAVNVQWITEYIVREDVQ